MNKFPLMDIHGNDSTECELRWGENWLAVDLDGTLCEYHGFIAHDHFGDIIRPIADAMEARHQAGWRIAIYTARADTVEHALFVKNYLAEQGIGFDLLTNVKKPYFKEFWDDRAVQVESNSGKLVCANQKDDHDMGPQVGGEHYKKYVIQPVEFCHVNKVPSIESSVMKYILRHAEKNGVEDLEKAIHLIKILAKLEYGAHI